MIRALGVLILLSTLLWALSLSVGAEEVEQVGESVPDTFFDFLDALPQDVLELLPSSLFSSNAEDVGNAAEEMSSFPFLLRAVVFCVRESLSGCFEALITVVGLLLLSAVFSSCRSAFTSPSIAKAFAWASSLAILVAIVRAGYLSLSSVTDYFTRLNQLTAGAIPLLGTLYAMGGNVTAAATSSAGLSVYLVLLEEIVGNSILPFCGVCLALSFLSSPQFGVRAGSLLGTVKKQYTTLLAFLMMLLLAMIATQTTLASKADTLAMRSVKFAAGNLIPVVGGSVSELIRTVGAGIGYLRGVIGICGVLLLILFLLPTFVRLLLYRLVWQIGASLADLLGCDGEKRLLDEIASLCGYLLAAVSICSSVLLLSLTLLAHCALAIG